MLPPTRQNIREIVLRLAGASHVGITDVCEVSDDAVRLHEEWLSRGRHADMSYMERYSDVRRNPALLLDGAKTLIVAAFSFANPVEASEMRHSGRPAISEYALGTDYHKELRKRLRVAAGQIEADFGGKTRVCIDTAPLRERYWARRAGLGFIGKNNYLVIPGEGAHFFLGTILWTGSVEDGPDAPCTLDCGNCGACIKACPTGALGTDGSLDARKCLSYLTIESRAPFPDDINPRNCLFGCDTCRIVCPHSKSCTATPIEAFRPRTEILSLTTRDWLSMTPDRFKTLFADSPLLRTGLDRLRQIASRGK